VAVMYLGKLVEMAETGDLFSNPLHPYTEALISAVPVPDPEYIPNQIILEGDVPSPMAPPTGCYFHPRCRYAKNVCAREAPPYRDVGGGHWVSCHFALSLSPLQPVRVL
jgi:peptide/nickel transport system ATP-binding protein